MLAYDKVRCVGDAVALVAAETEEIAKAALKLIEVDYELLPVVASAEAALAEDAPLIHGGATSSNLQSPTSTRVGGGLRLQEEMVS